MAVSEEEAYAAALHWINTAKRAEQLVAEFVPTRASGPGGRAPCRSASP
jgi:hypothetical protein